MMTGRTLLGHTSAGQQLDDHYFGSIPTLLNVHERFGARMYVTWDTSKTRHNEVAQINLSWHLF
jgi:glutamine synthetase